MQEIQSIKERSAPQVVDSSRRRKLAQPWNSTAPAPITIFFSKSTKKWRQQDKNFWNHDR